MSLALLFVSLSTAQSEGLSVDSLPLVEELPDPFLFQDGHRVRTLEDWQARREEMRELILRYEYGHVPPAPGNVRLDEELESAVLYDGNALHKVMRLSMGPENKVATTLHLYMPQAGAGPYPAVVRVGIDDSCAEMITRRGYAYACFEHRDLDPDTEGHDVVGPAQTIYPEYDWASLAVWAWGASRVLDYLVTLPDINPGQVAVTGHSRTGKAALLAGVLDERFALVVPNGSGCGGAGVYRNTERGAETLKFITLAMRFKSWFQKDFGLFSNQEVRLPFDQHFMRALVAPRTVLNTDALGDRWANPSGTQAAWMAAQAVCDWLGASRNNLCHFREGGHDQLPEDYEVLLDVADHVFRNKPLTRDFSTLPVPNLKPAWSWKAPDSVR